MQIIKYLKNAAFYVYCLYTTINNKIRHNVKTRVYNQNKSFK